MDPRRRVNLKLPDAMHHRIKVIAAERGTTVQGLIEQLCLDLIAASPVKKTPPARRERVA